MIWLSIWWTWWRNLNRSSWCNLLSWNCIILGLIIKYCGITCIISLDWILWRSSVYMLHCVRVISTELRRLWLKFLSCSSTINIWNVTSISTIFEIIRLISLTRRLYLLKAPLQIVVGSIGLRSSSILRLTVITVANIRHRHGSWNLAVGGFTTISFSQLCDPFVCACSFISHIKLRLSWSRILSPLKGAVCCACIATKKLCRRLTRSIVGSIITTVGRNIWCKLKWSGITHVIIYKYI